MLINDIAKICHEANKSLCEGIGDFSQPSWEYAPDWQRESAIDGVKFHVANENATPSASHDNWLKEKYANGWKFGLVKDPDKKEHPCCVPFNELPKNQQIKDILFSSIVKVTKPLLAE